MKVGLRAQYPVVSTAPVGAPSTLKRVSHASALQPWWPDDVCDDVLSFEYAGSEGVEGLFFHPNNSEEPGSFKWGANPEKTPKANPDQFVEYLKKMLYGFNELYTVAGDGYQFMRNQARLTGP